MGDAERATDVVPLKVATGVWWREALQSFGGPAGQISVMHRELIVERRWFGEQRFLHALSYCTLMPGPEAKRPRSTSAGCSTAASEV